MSGTGNIKASREDAKMKVQAIIKSVKDKKSKKDHEKVIQYGEELQSRAGYDDDLIKWIVKSGQLPDHLVKRWWGNNEKAVH